jgi:hypothetical protein
LKEVKAAPLNRRPQSAHAETSGQEYGDIAIGPRAGLEKQQAAEFFQE